MKSKVGIALIAVSTICFCWACWFSVRFFGEILSDVASDRPIGDFPLFAYQSNSPLYAYPLPLIIWAGFIIRKKEISPGDFHLFLSVSLFASVAFFAIFLLALVIPFTDTGPIILHPIEFKPE